MGKAKMGLRAAAVLAASGMALAACGSSGGGGGTTPGGGSSSGGSEAQGKKGGELTFITSSEQFNHLDPQRNYTGEDLAFANGYLQRTLTAYTISSDDSKAGELVPDLATDTGTPSDDAKTWEFTLKDGLKFEDGSDITCADVKYGVSRTFATDVITDGPTYAISMLDIPEAEDGSSVYKGPYAEGTPGQAEFDKAVQCSSDDKTITFKLKDPVADFNYTVTLLAFSPVPQEADTGEGYDDKPISSGPYKIENYTKGQNLTLVRNDNWSDTTDDYRPAYPDTINVQFAVDPAVVDQRMLDATQGEDATAITLGDSLQPENLATVFADGSEYQDRAVNAFDPYVRYIAINTAKLPDLKQRQAILAAADRAALLTIAGGEYAGDLADGVIKPNLDLDYQPTGLFTGALGQEIPDAGDPEYAKKLIEESGKPMPTLTFDYPQTPANDNVASSLIQSLGKAGITVKANPIERGTYYSVVQNPDRANELISAGWGPDWLNASTVIPELFTPTGGFNLSEYDNPDFNQKVATAKAETDRKKQGEMWAELNKEAAVQALTLPTRFGRAQRLHGANVGGADFLWAPYGSWAYAGLYVNS